MTETQNSPFPLSQKYLDFLRYVASAEFLEGTTSAGKTTVAVPKFMFRISDYKGTKPSIISGLDLGTIEKNIINSDHGLIDVFGEYDKNNPNNSGKIEYNPTGKGKIRLPHILFHTHNGIKIIYVLGYDNKKRWKKALGGQYFGLFIDEFNIADMDYVREAFMRADYRLCTLNPDDPNKECFQQYVNKSRPVEKYKDSAPKQLLDLLNQPQKEDWTWWYFTFKDNASLTEEKLKKITESVPVGTKLYKNKILGLRGKTTGLVFVNFDRTKHCITKEKAKQFVRNENKEETIQLLPKMRVKTDESEYFIKFTAGLDTAYSSLSPDTIAMSFAGITNKGKYILLDEKVYNNAELQTPLAPSDTVRNFIDFLERNRKEWGFAKDVFIDNADQATIKEFEKFKRQFGSIYVFNNAWKAKMQIIDRINTQLGWFATDYFYVVDTCVNYINELEVYSWQEDKDSVPEDGNDHMVNSVQYSFIPYAKIIGIGDNK